MDPSRPHFDEQVRSVLGVHSVDEIVIGTEVGLPKSLRLKGISVISLEELYEDLTGQCLEPRNARDPAFARIDMASRWGTIDRPPRWPGLLDCIVHTSSHQRACFGPNGRDP